jgi:hypothetical protein
MVENWEFKPAVDAGKQANIGNLTYRFYITPETLEVFETHNEVTRSVSCNLQSTQNFFANFVRGRKPTYRQRIQARRASSLTLACWQVPAKELYEIAVTSRVEIEMWALLGCLPEFVPVVL